MTRRGRAGRQEADEATPCSGRCSARRVDLAGGAGLAGDLIAGDLRLDPGAVLDDLGEHARQHLSGVRADHAVGEATARRRGRRPSVPTLPRTSRGCTHVPPFAIVA